LIANRFAENKKAVIAASTKDDYVNLDETVKSAQ
jgi:hypothetical protein